MENFRNELYMLANKLVSRVKERQDEYDSFLSETGLTPSAYTIGQLEHVLMEIKNFGKAVENAQYHESTVPNFTLSYHQLIDSINVIKFKTLNS